MEMMIKLLGAAWVSKAVSVAARLGLADLLAPGPRPCSELAAATETNPEVLERLLRVLASTGVFEVTADGRFRNSAVSEYLLTHHPLSLRHFAILAGEEYYTAWGDLLHTVRTGEPAFRHVYGDAIYGYMERHPETARVYDLAMEDLSRPVGALLAGRLDFLQARTVVDVGGGSGVLLKKILAAHPHLTGIVVDREDVCTRAAAQVPPALEERLRYLPGDFFGELPPGADVYFLKNVLHNWNEESCIRILTSVRIAMAGKPEARLYVIEPLVEPDDQSPRRVVNALFQVVICEEGTRERTRAEMEAMLTSAGLSAVGMQELPTSHTVVEAKVGL